MLKQSIIKTFASGLQYKRRMIMSTRRNKYYAKRVFA